MKQPRVLVISIGRINASDTTNNGLLLRNLFGTSLPKENIAQLYSSGNNGDTGFFGHYYQLQNCDRVLGSLFYKLKENTISPPLTATNNTFNTSVKKLQKLKAFIQRILIDT